MIGHLTLLACLVAGPPSVDSGPSISPTAFRTSFDQALAGKLSMPVAAKLAAKGYRYVFVGGFMNEGMSEYFKQNARELRTMGVPRKAIHYVYPSSHETIERNAVAVRERFHEFAALGPEKLVVIAHSRGACDVLFFALTDPQFVSKHIQALFLIQGPFGGTGLADYLIGEGPAIDKSMPLKQRLIALRLGRIKSTHWLGASMAGSHHYRPRLHGTSGMRFWKNIKTRSPSSAPGPFM